MVTTWKWLMETCTDSNLAKNFRALHKTWATFYKQNYWQISASHWMWLSDFIEFHLHSVFHTKTHSVHLWGPTNMLNRFPSSQINCQTYCILFEKYENCIVWIHVSLLAVFFMTIFSTWYLKTRGIMVKHWQECVCCWPQACVPSCMCIRAKKMTTHKKPCSMAMTDPTNEVTEYNNKSLEIIAYYFMNFMNLSSDIIW